MVAVLVPALRHPQLNARPHVHHGDGQRVQLVLTALEAETAKGGKRVVLEGVDVKGRVRGAALEPKDKEFEIRTRVFQVL